jgi:hypothetical protein
VTGESPKARVKKPLRDRGKGVLDMKSLRIIWRRWSEGWIKVNSVDAPAQIAAGQLVIPAGFVVDR